MDIFCIFSLEMFLVLKGKKLLGLENDSTNVILNLSSSLDWKLGVLVKVVG